MLFVKMFSIVNYWLKLRGERRVSGDTRRSRKHVYLEDLDRQIIERHRLLSDLSERRNKLLERVISDREDLIEGGYIEEKSSNNGSGVEGIAFDAIDQIGKGFNLTPAMTKNIKLIIRNKPEVLDILQNLIQKNIMDGLEKASTGKVIDKGQISK